MSFLGFFCVVLAVGLAYLAGYDLGRISGRIEELKGETKRIQAMRDDVNSKGVA